MTAAPTSPTTAKTTSAFCARDRAAVFEGIREHLLQPELLSPYLAEYAQAAAALQAPRGDEAARLKAQLAEAEKAIDNLLAVAAKPGAHGAARLAAEVDRKEQERLGYEQALTTAMRKRPAAPTRPEDVIAGMDRHGDALQEVWSRHGGRRR